MTMLRFAFVAPMFVDFYKQATMQTGISDLDPAIHCFTSTKPVLPHAPSSIDMQASVVYRPVDKENCGG